MSRDNLEFILYSSRPCDTADLSMGIVRIGPNCRKFSEKPDALHPHEPPDQTDMVLRV
jgi:hypothetical protein